MKRSIPVVEPHIGIAELRAAEEALRMKWLGMGSYVGEFEEALGRYLQLDKSRRVVLTSSATAGIHLSFLAAGISAGDEVIMAPLNFVGVAQMVLAVGAKPVFCDIDDKTLCINPLEAEKLVGPRTRAILLMDYSCSLCDYASFATLARQHDLRLIHDAAHSFSSNHRGQPIGSFSDICVFSFDPIKTITCIDAGAIIVNVSEESKLRAMRYAGMEQSTEMVYSNKKDMGFDVSYPGYRYHVPNLHAAIGLAQLAQIEQLVASRRIAARTYTQKLRTTRCIRTPIDEFDSITPFLYPIRVDSQRRENIRAELAANGIQTNVHWPLINWFKLFRDAKCGNLGIAEKASSELISIPLYSDLFTKDQDYVIDCLQQIT